MSLKRLLRRFLSHEQFDREMSDELRDHLERRTADLVRAGLSPVEARRRARLEFGALEAYKEQLRDGQAWAVIRNLPEQLRRSHRFALRRLRQSPMFTAFSIVTLAIGIGVSTATYSFVSSAIHADSGVREPETLMRITQNTTGTLTYSQFSWPDVTNLAVVQTVYRDVAAFASFSSALADGTSSEIVAGESVTGNMFSMIGVDAAMGRVILPADDRADSPGVVLLSDRTWRRQFGSDPRIVGRPLRMAGRVFEVVGVLPASFRSIAGWGRAASVWVPLATAPAATARTGAAVFDRADRNARELMVLARLAPGRRLADAEAEATGLAARLDAIAPWPLRPPERRIVHASVAFDNSRLIRGLSGPAIFIFLLPALVLLVACTNLGNLVLSRGVARQHEFAVRRALGASRARIITEQLVEGSMIALAGGGGGLLVAAAILDYVGGLTSQVLGHLPELQFEAHLDANVLAVAAGFAFLCLLVSSLSPAIQLTRTGDRRVLTSDGGLSVVPKWRSQSNLIAIQVTVSVALFLLTALGVTVLTFEMPVDGGRAGWNRIGFVSIPFSRQQADEARVRATLDRVVARARQIPGVDAVEVASIPDSRQRTASTVRVTIPARPFGTVYEGEWMALTAATPGVFEMIGATIKFGRPFDDRDLAGTPEVAVINEGLAGKLFQHQNAVGRDVLVRVNGSRQPPRTMRIVGITTNTTDRSGRITSEIYVPFAQHFEPDMSLLARSSTLDVSSLVTALRTSLYREDPDVAISYAGRADLAVSSFGGLIAGFMTGTAAALAMLTLILSMTGLYGVLSMVVAKRTREMGLRMALGADRSRIASLVLKDGFRPILEGLFIGLAAATVLRMLMQPMFQSTITAFDPIAVAFAVVPLLAAGAVACYLPALRATRVEPSVALRNL